MKAKGIPGRGATEHWGCLGLEALPMEEQLLTVMIVEQLMEKVGYWDSFLGES